MKFPEDVWKIKCTSEKGIHWLGPQGRLVEKEEEAILVDKNTVHRVMDSPLLTGEYSGHHVDGLTHIIKHGGPEGDEVCDKCYNSGIIPGGITADGIEMDASVCSCPHGEVHWE